MLVKVLRYFTTKNEDILIKIYRYSVLRTLGLA